MRVLAYLHTFNDAGVIEQAIEGLRRQTRPPDAILIVDNASTDGTLDRAFPETVSIVSNLKNLGTSGAVGIGLARALENGFDWTWIMDPDSVPEPDALKNLLAFYERLLPATQEQVCFLAGWPLTVTGELKGRGPIALDGAKITYLSPGSVRGFNQCDSTVWCGSLYRMAAVARIGLPSADYMIDVGELEYGYRARQLGFTSYIVDKSVIRCDVGRNPGSAMRLYRFGPINFELYKLGPDREISPVRCYYNTRNHIYFWLYQFKPRHLRRALRSIVGSLALTSSFVVRPASYRRQLIACLRGIRDGLTMHMERRY